MSQVRNLPTFRHPSDAWFLLRRAAQAVGEEALHGGLLEVVGSGDQAVLGGDGALQLPQDGGNPFLLGHIGKRQRLFFEEAEMAVVSAARQIEMQDRKSVV